MLAATRQRTSIIVHDDVDVAISDCPDAGTICISWGSSSIHLPRQQALAALAAFVAKHTPDDLSIRWGKRAIFNGQRAESAEARLAQIAELMGEYPEDCNSGFCELSTDDFRRIHDIATGVVNPTTPEYDYTPDESARHGAAEQVKHQTVTTKIGWSTTGETGTCRRTNAPGSITTPRHPPTKRVNLDTPEVSE